MRHLWPKTYYLCILWNMVTLPPTNLSWHIFCIYYDMRHLYVIVGFLTKLFSFLQCLVRDYTMIIPVNCWIEFQRHAISYLPFDVDYAVHVEIYSLAMTMNSR